MKGDVLIAVDGESIGDMPAADASHLLSGKLNSKVAVQVQRGEGGQNLAILNPVNLKKRSRDRALTSGLAREFFPANAAQETVSLIRDVPLDRVTTADAEIGVQVCLQQQVRMFYSSLSIINNQPVCHVLTFLRSLAASVRAQRDARHCGFDGENLRSLMWNQDRRRHHAH
jgi:hypothetical protein